MGTSIEDADVVRLVMCPVRGLTSADAAARLAQVGPNELERADAASPWRILARQFASPVIWLLVVAAGVSAAIGEVVDAIAIATILVVNAFVGFFQEYRADRAVLALRAMTAPRARILRDGRVTIIPAVEVVPGDMLILEAGDVVAADANLVEAHRMTANEAALTGESVPSDKRRNHVCLCRRERDHEVVVLPRRSSPRRRCAYHRLDFRGLT